jgi:hypothetical protein
MTHHEDWPGDTARPPHQAAEDGVARRLAEHTAEKAAGRVSPSVLRRVITEAMGRAEAAGMDRRTTEEWIAIEILGSSLIPLTTDGPPRMTEAERTEFEQSSWFQQEYRRSKKRNEALGTHGMVVTGTGFDVPTRPLPSGSTEATP